MYKAREIIRMLEKDGWTHFRTRGSHYHFRHPQKKGRVTIPYHGARTLNPKLCKEILKRAELEWKK